MGSAAIRKSWCIVWVGLVLAFCLAGCQGLFPQPVYTPPVTRIPQAPPPPPPPVARPTFYVAVRNTLNLRAGPGMDFFMLAVLQRNEEVEKVGESGDWSQIRVKRDGTIGWVNSRYLSPNPVAATPEVAPPPIPPEAVTPPPLPEIPATPKPPPPTPPAVEKPPKAARPGEVPAPAIIRKPEEAQPPRRAKPAKPAEPEEEEAPEPEQPRRVKPEKPAPEPPAVKPTPPATPEPEKPGKIRIM
jgi:Bacterial SH3 domain